MIILGKMVLRLGWALRILETYLDYNEWEPWLSWILYVLNWVFKIFLVTALEQHTSNLVNLFIIDKHFTLGLCRWLLTLTQNNKYHIQWVEVPHTKGLSAWSIPLISSNKETITTHAGTKGLQFHR